MNRFDPKLKTPIPWIINALTCWLLILGSVYFTNLYLNPVSFTLCIMIVASRHHALLLLGHDAAHYLVSKNKSLNDFFCYLFVSPTGFALKRYRKFHFLHHRHLNTERDPEMHFRSEKLPDYKLPKTKKDLIRILLQHFTLVNYRYTIEIYSMFRPSGLIDYISIYGSILLILSIVAWNKTYWVYILILLIYLIFFPLLFRFRTWTEHWGSEYAHVISANPIERFFLYPCNTCYHKEHHLNPSAPYWYLPHLRTEKDKAQAISTRQLLGKLFSCACKTNK
ncbi:TPA: hypothetical protein JA361_01010 [Legionella pneumophila]|nr:hypothetical protein [Legionella pneumophila]HAT8182231.1 hypothetical protein [Legionella pneumophila]